MTWRTSVWPSTAGSPVAAEAVEWSYSPLASSWAKPRRTFLNMFQPAAAAKATALALWQRTGMIHCASQQATGRICFVTA